MPFKALLFSYSFENGNLIKYLKYQASSSLYEQDNLGKVSINAIEVNENVKEDKVNDLKANPRAKSSKVSDVL